MKMASTQCLNEKVNITYLLRMVYVYSNGKDPYSVNGCHVNHEFSIPTNTLKLTNWISYSKV